LSPPPFPTGFLSSRFAPLTLECKFSPFVFPPPIYQFVCTFATSRFFLSVFPPLFTLFAGDGPLLFHSSCSSPPFFSPVRRPLAGRTPTLYHCPVMSACSSPNIAFFFLNVGQCFSLTSLPHTPPFRCGTLVQLFCL